MNKNIAVLDCQLGDCGKGRFTHDLSKDADYVVRFCGAGNSGHQVYRNGKKYTHHLLPSVDYVHSKAKSFLGYGMMINPEELLAEIQIMEADFPGIAKTVIVDPDAFCIFQRHIEQDKTENGHIGSTNKGVGPATSDKFGRKGTRIYHLIKDNAEIIQKLRELGVQFIPVLKLREELEQSSILFEGAQSILLDLQCAPYYPYCTTADCTVSGIYSSGFHFVRLDKVHACMKPYLTKSGNGPMLTEMPEDEASKIRARGNEIGSTTGRNRRIGYLDLPAVKYAIQKGGITHLIITKIDILDGEERVKVCISYGKEVFSPGDFVDLKPEYIELPGWNDSKKIKEQYNHQILYFTKYIKNFTKTPVSFISVGIGDNDIAEM